MIGIYKITSPSGRVYIGQSINIEKRFKDYKSFKNCKSQHKLYRSFLKYGVLSHTFEFIHECSVDELNNLERYYQEIYNVIETGLNCLLTSTKDRKQLFSKETLKRKSEAVKGEKHPNFGKKLSEETRLKISTSQKGKFIPDDVRLKISKSTKGVKKNKPGVKGLKNGNARKIVSENIKTGEKLILNLADTASYFNVNRDLITTRISGDIKTFRKLKDWIFYDYSK